MNTDPIADLLTRIRNATKAHHEKVNIPYSIIKEGILKVMKDMKFIDGYSVNTEGKFKVLEVKLSTLKEDMVLKRISKPGQRIYIQSKDLKIIKNGLGITILSTPKGIMSNLDARKQKIGGEVLCEIK